MLAHAYAYYWDLWILYHKVTFDGENRIIRVNEGVTELDIKTDVYSDWKEWVKSMPDNAGWLPAIRTIGGDNTVSGQRAGDIYFLKNNWKLYIDITKVKVTGALFSDNFDTAYHDLNGVPVFPAEVASLVTTAEISTNTGSGSGEGGATAAEIWQYSTRTLTTASGPTASEIAEATAAETWQYSTRTLTTASGPTASEIADAVWDEASADHNTAGTMGHLLNEVDYLEKELWVNTELGSNGEGSQESPYNVLNDAKDRAEADGIRVINLIGDVTLTRNFKNYTLKGIGLPEVDFNGQNIKNSKFENVKVKGAFLDGSAVIVRDSIVLDTAQLEGVYENCALGGDLTCQDGAVVLLKDCASNIPGTSRPTISMNAAGTSQLSVRGYNGGLTIKDSNNAADRVTVEVNPGSVTFDASCTNGIMVARGVGKFVDSTTGATVVNEMVNQEMIDDMEGKVLELWRLAGLDASNVASITDTSITVGGVTITIGQPDSNTTTLTRS